MNLFIIFIFIFILGVKSSVSSHVLNENGQGGTSTYKTLGGRGRGGRGRKNNYNDYY